MEITLYDAIVTWWFAVSITSFIGYKFLPCGMKTYGEAIRFCTIGLLELALEGVVIIWERFKNWNTSSKEHNTLLYLTNQEVLEFVGKLKDVIEFPKLRNYSIDENGILCIEVDAIALVLKYKDIDAYNLREIIRNITEMYYMETREYKPIVYVPIATGNHILIKIPLSPYAEKILEDNQNVLQEESTDYDYLEEECILDERTED